MIRTKPPFRKPGEDIKSGIGGVANADISHIVARLRAECIVEEISRALHCGPIYAELTCP
jgi:hypothetical protein